MTQRGAATRTIAGGIGIGLALAAVGCTSSDEDAIPSAADCSNQVRLDGVVYTSYGYTERKAVSHAAADAAECRDVGEHVPGSVFPERPRQITVWTFRGYPPEQVVGVRFDADSFAVYVADSTPSAERERIFRELRQPAG